MCQHNHHARRNRDGSQSRLRRRDPALVRGSTRPVADVHLSRVLAPPLGLRLPAAAAPAVAHRTLQSRPLRRGAGPDPGRAMARDARRRTRRHGNPSAYQQRRTRLPRRPAAGVAQPARTGVFATDGPGGVVLHADGVAAARRPASGRDRLRLHGRAQRVRSCATSASATRTCVAAKGRHRVHRRPQPVRSQARLTPGRVLFSEQRGRRSLPASA